VLNTLGGQLALDVIKNFASITPLPQDESKASFTKRMERQDGFIDLYNPPPPKQLDRMIRAYYPWPNVWTKTAIRGREQLIKFLPKQKLQAEGGKPMGLKDFLNGYPQLAPAIEDIFPK
jgi:methionyl-tRNA formyltransferase